MFSSEVLAPAGSMDAVIAAVYSGADAIYCGSPDFNARKNAANLTDQQFEEAVRLCHRHGVKVYQTLNTVLYDSELDAFKRTLRRACEVGVDALIVQDLAVYRLVRECCPQMPLHGSTQMTVHTVAGAQQLKNMGFERVVLAREMSRKEIEHIQNNVDIETEVFVHGALCMCVSGQCYLSAMLGQRSGNRGLCAQPCRLPFSSDGKTERYDLSLKDLSLVEQLRDLQNMGITSLKIEGRMKRPEYVAAAVTACKEALNGTVSATTQHKLQSVFSRSGFTDGYYTEQRGKAMFGTRQKADVTAADAGVLKELATLYRQPKQTVPLTVSLKADTDKAVLTVCDGKHSVVATAAAQAAQNLPTDYDTAYKSLSKTGGTPYYIDTLTVQNDGAFLPVSVLNALRRDALEQLNTKREQHTEIPFVDVPLSFERHRAATYALRLRFQTQEQITALAEQIADKVILPLYDVDEALVQKWGERLIAELPRAKFGTEETVVKRLQVLKTAGLSRVMIHNIGDVKIAQDMGLMIHGGFGLNVTNSLSLEQYKALGLQDTVVSFELNFPKIRALNGTLPRGILSYGYFPLMLTRNCPGANTGSCEKCSHKRELVDRRGVKFPLICSGGCTEVLNSLPVYLADLPEHRAGCDFGVLYFTRESADEVDAHIRAYTEHGNKRDNITRGLYNRGSL